METSLLGLGAGWWNVAMLAMLGAVVVALCLLAVTAAGVIIVQRKEVAIQERALDEYRAEAGQKIAQARALAARAVERAALANERTAKLEAESRDLRTRNTTLQHEANIASAAPPPAPALPSTEKFLATIARAPSGRADISYPHDCASCHWLAQWMAGVLLETGWHVKGAEPLSASAAAPEKQSWNVRVITRHPEKPKHEREPRAFDALMAALQGSLGSQAHVVDDKDPALADDHVKIAIQPRT